MLKSIVYISFIIMALNSLKAGIYPTIDLNGGSIYSKSDTFTTNLNVISPNFDLTWEINDKTLLSLGASYSDFTDNSIYNYLEPKLKYQIQLTEEDDEFSSHFFTSIGSKYLTSSDITTDVINANIGYSFSKLLFETFSLNASSGFRYKSFTTLSEYNYAEVPLQVSLSTSFETKTSVRFDLGFFSKLYTINEFTYIEPIQEGRNENSMMKRNDLFKGTQIANKIEFGLSLGQNVFESTGIGLKFKHSQSLENYNKYTPDFTFEFFLDSDLYSDPYSQSFTQYSVSLTQMLPFDIRLSLNYDYYTREYYAWISDLSRDEQMNSLSIDVSRSFDFEDSFINTMDVYFYYDSNNNLSNNQYYDYNMNLIAIGISLGF